MALIPDPKKRLICREEPQRVHDRRPLGAAIRSSGFFSRPEKYCPNGGMAFADRYAMRGENRTPPQPPVGRKPYG